MISIAKERKAESWFCKNLLIQIIILIAMFSLAYINRNSIKIILALICIHSLNWLIISFRVWRWICK